MAGEPCMTWSGWHVLRIEDVMLDLRVKRLGQDGGADSDETPSARGVNQQVIIWDGGTNRKLGFQKFFLPGSPMWDNLIDLLRITGVK